MRLLSHPPCAAGVTGFWDTLSVKTLVGGSNSAWIHAAKYWTNSLRIIIGVDYLSPCSKPPIYLCIYSIFHTTHLPRIPICPKNHARWVVYVHLFKHIYSHEGFHLASDSCRFSNQCPPNTAPPAPKIMGCSSSKIRSLKSRPPKPNPLQPTHLVYPTSLAMARHKSGKLRAIRVSCMFVFCSLPRTFCTCHL